MRTANEIGNYCIENHYNDGLKGSIFKHFEVIERNLTANENVLFAFVSNSVKDRKGKIILGRTIAIVLTEKI